MVNNVPCFFYFCFYFSVCISTVALFVWEEIYTTIKRHSFFGMTA